MLGVKTNSQTTGQSPTWRDYEQLARYIGSQRLRLALLAILLLSGIALQLINPQILRFFVDAARAGTALDALLRAAVLFFVIALVSQLLSIAAGYVSQWVSFTAMNRLRVDLALHCVKLDMSFHNRRTPGEMIQRIDGDISALANLFSNFVIVMVGNAVLLTGVLVILWFQEWHIGLALTIWMALGIWALNTTRVAAVPRWRALSQAGAEYAGFLEQRLGGVEDILPNGAVPYSLRRMAIHLRTLYHTGLAARLMAATGTNVYLALFVLGILISLGLGGYLYSQGAMTLGTVYLVFTYTGFAVIPIRALADQFQYLQQAGASLLRVQELFNMKSQIQEPVEARPLTPGSLAVEFANVSFAYGNEAVLHDVSFRIEPCRVLGLLGRTGSGKTTISRLIERLYDPTAGTVRLGNVNTRELALSDLRRRVALVTQDVQLFHATIRDNLTFFDRNLQDERLLAVLRDLGLEEWLAAQSQGLDTLLGPGGAGLSAGQAQLLAFARAFLRDPSLVILDEASSRLDPATARLVQIAVDRLLDRRTGIIIAHRLETVHRADEILILENGCIQEYGVRERLARDPQSRFHLLLQTGIQEVLA